MTISTTSIVRSPFWFRSRPLSYVSESEPLVWVRVFPRTHDQLRGRKKEITVLVESPIDDSFKFLSVPTVFETQQKWLKTNKKMF